MSVAGNSYVEGWGKSCEAIAGSNVSTSEVSDIWAGCRVISRPTTWVQSRRTFAGTSKVVCTTKDNVGGY